VVDVLGLRHPVVQELLQLSDVAGQAHQQGVPQPVGAGVVGAAQRHRSARHRVPQCGGGVVQPQVDVAVLGHGGKHLQPGA
jgi:hypothetical protein